MILLFFHSIRKSFWSSRCRPKKRPINPKTHPGQSQGTPRFLPRAPPWASFGPITANLCASWPYLGPGCLDLGSSWPDPSPSCHHFRPYSQISVSSWIYLGFICAGRGLTLGTHRRPQSLRFCRCCMMMAVHVSSETSSLSSSSPAVWRQASCLCRIPRAP